MENSLETQKVDVTALISACFLNSIGYETNDIFLEITPWCNIIIASNPTYTNKHTQDQPFGHWKRDHRSPEYENYTLLMLKRYELYT